MVASIALGCGDKGLFAHHRALWQQVEGRATRCRAPLMYGERMRGAACEMRFGPLSSLAVSVARQGQT
jgi:hypothetical protein